MNCHYAVSQKKKRRPFYICDNLVDIVQFCQFFAELPPGNLKQTHMHSRPYLVSYIRTVPCKNKQRFLRHAVQRQIWSIRVKVQLPRRITIRQSSQKYVKTAYIIKANQRRRGLQKSYVEHKELQFSDRQLQISDERDYMGAHKFNFAPKFAQNGGF